MLGHVFECLCDLIDGIVRKRHMTESIAKRVDVSHCVLDGEWPLLGVGRNVACKAPYLHKWLKIDLRSAQEVSKRLKEETIGIVMLARLEENVDPPIDAARECSVLYLEGATEFIP